MSEQGKARHFKLTVDYDGFLPKLFFNNFVVPSNFKNREQLTVIEYSAFEQLQKENEALKAKLEKCVEALLKLNNEVAAMIATHGDAIAIDYGRTNLECLEYRLDIARKTLKEIEGMK